MSEPKKCLYCEKPIAEYWPVGKKKTHLEIARTIYCSASCSAKHNNPMRQNFVPAKNADLPLTAMDKFLRMAL